MPVIDMNKLKASVERKHDPFEFYLFVTLSENGRIVEDNPYYADRKFLETLLDHYEAKMEFEKCIDIRDRISKLAC